MERVAIVEENLKTGRNVAEVRKKHYFCSEKYK
jgi:hypothetical protein